MLLLAVSRNLVAQNDLVQTFDQFGTAQGLDSETGNNVIYQDRQGFLWVNSYGGLNRYAGDINLVYPPTPDDPAALPGAAAALSRFFEDEDGGLWFCNTLSIERYDPEGDCFDHYVLIGPDGKTLKRGYYWLWLDPGSDAIYFGVDRKVWVTDSGMLPHANLVSDTLVNTHTVMHRTDGGRLYLLRQHYGDIIFQVWELDPTTRKIIRIWKIPSPRGTEIIKIFFSPAGECYVSCVDGLYRYYLIEQRFGEEIRTRGGNPLRNVQGMGWSGSQVYIATYQQGVFIENDNDRVGARGPIRAYTDGNLEPFLPSIESAYLDRDDNLWIAEEEGPVHHFNLRQHKFGAFFLGDPDGRRFFRSATEAGDKLYVTTESGMLTVAGSSGMPTYEQLPTNGKDIAAITFAETATDGTVYVGTLEHLLRKRPGEQKFRILDPRPEPISNLPGYLFCLPTEEGVYLGTNEYGALYLENGKDVGDWVNLPGRRISCMAFRDSMFYYGSLSGDLYVGLLDGLDFTALDSIELGDLPIDIAVDKNNHSVFVGGYANAYRIDLTDNRLTAKSLPLPSAGTTSIELDAGGKLWASGSSGLYRYDPSTDQVVTYSVRDGLQGDRYYYTGSGRLADGRLVFPGKNGVNIFHPDSIRPTLPPARPTIVGLTVNGVPWQDLQRPGPANPHFLSDINLAFDETDLSFQLASRAFADPDNNEFRYRLSRGNSGSGTFLNTTDRLQLSGLAPGSYLLEIQACNADKVWSDAVHSLRLQVAPPWYRTTLAYLLYALALVGLTYLIYRRRLARMTLQERLKTDRAEALQRAAETETSVLRLQMNPHFIFNSLNSIDDYIMEEDPLAAHDYLSLFADLIRDILNRSTQPLTRLDQEIELLERYVAAESIRLGGNLRFDVNVSDDIDAIATYIPTMILQPFVENAIWHGIGHRAGGGTVTLRFTLQDDLLVAEVEDDGVGRGQAGEKVHNHASKALSITRRRLDLLNTESGPSALKIVDLKDDAGDALGTRVVIALPVLLPSTDVED